MPRLTIEHFGPIAYADIELKAVNVITGPQSAGKSTVLKTACYCTWVEKRLALTQKVNGFGNGATFIERMVEYYKMSGYVHEDTCIAYETPRLRFRYDHRTKTFGMQWKSARWKYKRPKVSYVPADRNLVAAIPSWSALPLDGNMLEFMADWDKARRYVQRAENVLNLGMTYTYDPQTNTDRIRLEDGRLLPLKESSSGIQSLLPLYVHLEYLTRGQYEDVAAKISYEQKEERRNLLTLLYDKYIEEEKPREPKAETATVEGVDYGFPNRQAMQEFEERARNFLRVDHSEIFLEEPENNLFPPTQCQLVNRLLEAAQGHGDTLFIATHSPYVLNQVIKTASADRLAVFFTHPVEGERTLYSVRQLGDEEVREMYANGVDLFFNFELYL